MIVSMTGFGRAEGTFGSKIITVEIKSVNNRFCEISLKIPRYLNTKEFELREILRKKISRGKIMLSISIESEGQELPLQIDNEQVKFHLTLLKQLRKEIGSKESVKLEHIMKFSDIFTSSREGDISPDEFHQIAWIVEKAADDLNDMKTKEGESLRKDILQRIDLISTETDKIEKAASENRDQRREELKSKVYELFDDREIMSEKRLEYELLILSERLDITEECIRLRSHLKYFREHTNSKEPAGRRLNFLLQEINREVNTIGSKSMNAEISQTCSVLKEEIEKIREQIQNVE